MAMLASLIPGGPIETRDFSHLSPQTSQAFNACLTMLGIASIVVGALVWFRWRWTYILAGLLSLGYIAVYVLDLAEIFPVSPSPMPQLLWLIEWMGTILALITIYYVIHALRGTDASERIPSHYI